MNIDRWNMNTLRRYHVNGAIAVVTKEPGKPRRCAIIPRSTPLLSVPVEPSAILELIRAARSVAN